MSARRLPVSLHATPEIPMSTILDTAPLAARALSASYGSRRVLDHVSLDLPHGSVLGLIGKNGAGKTTLIRCLLGLQQPDAGAALVFGEPALRLSDAAKERLGYVPQQPEAFAWMQVGQMLDFIGTLYPRWDAGWVAATLARWQIDRRQLLAKLSPGERQRVAILRALAPQPELLVLDEPAAALDPVARREVLREIASRAGEQGTTVLFSTHIVSDLERVASHVAFLHEGRLLLAADIDHTKEAVGRLLLPAEAAIDVPPVTGELARRRLPDGSLSLVLQRQGEHWPALLQHPGARFDALSLEDLFIEVVG
jgi:ABC-2 type transport system ATP-binding protein